MFSSHFEQLFSWAKRLLYILWLETHISSFSIVKPHTGSWAMVCSCSAVKRWRLDIQISNLTAWLLITPPCRYFFFLIEMHEFKNTWIPHGIKEQDKMANPQLNVWSAIPIQYTFFCQCKPIIFPCSLTFHFVHVLNNSCAHTQSRPTILERYPLKSLL